MLGHHCDGLFTASRSEDCIAIGGEGALQGTHDFLLIIDHQDRSAAFAHRPLLCPTMNRGPTTNSKRMINWASRKASGLSISHQLRRFRAATAAGRQHNPQRASADNALLG